MGHRRMLVLLLLFFSEAVSAQSNFDCGKVYKSVLDKIKRDQDGKMPVERLAFLNRKAQRIYDACQTGHLADPQALFDDLDRGKN